MCVSRGVNEIGASHRVGLAYLSVLALDSQGEMWAAQGSEDLGAEGFGEPGRWRLLLATPNPGVRAGGCEERGASSLPLPTVPV
jgi:hypothetical protein